MTCEAGKALGAAKVFAVGTNKERLKFSLSIGADAALNTKECNWVSEVKKQCSHLDAVIDMTGNPLLINQAIDALSTAGRLVHVGMVPAELTIPDYMYRVVYRELKITGLFGRHLYTTWDILDSLLENGRVKLEHYVGETLPLGQYEKAIQDFGNLTGRAILLPEEK
jgi:threonine 3-dehydrogenase